MQGAWTVSYYPEVSAAYRHRRREADRKDYGVGFSVWQIRISEDYSHVASRILASKSQEGRKDLEERRVEGTAEAAEEGQIMA